MSEDNHQARLKKILDRLVTRSEQCPGMFPVSSQQHWQQLAILHEPAAQESTRQLWQTLESFDRDPQQAHQVLNRLLAQNSTVQLMSVDADAKSTARERLAAIEALLSSPNSHYKFKHG